MFLLTHTPLCVLLSHYIATKFTTESDHKRTLRLPGEGRDPSFAYATEQTTWTPAFAGATAHLSVRV